MEWYGQWGKGPPDREYAQQPDVHFSQLEVILLPVGESALAAAGIIEGSTQTYEPMQNHSSLPHPWIYPQDFSWVNGLNLIE